MKRYGNLYEKICSMDNLYLAFQHAKKGKGWYKEVQQIEKRPYYYLAGLQWMLQNHLYKTSEYATFTKKDGKKEREIYKLPFFPDRIAQLAVLQVIEPQLLAYFTDDTYSAIPNKGIHAAYKKLRLAVDTVPEEMTYCLKNILNQFSLMLIGTIKIISRKVVKSMKEYGKVRSTKQPEQKVIDDYSVWVAENITPVTEAGTDEQPGFTGYEYDLTQYTKDEYIKMIDDKNASLEDQMTQAQEAMCEIYEMMA